MERRSIRILLWYWGRRGGGAQYALSLAEALAPNGLALSLSSQNTLISAFRELPVPLQEVSTYSGPAGFVSGFARLPWLGAELIRFAREQGADVVLSSMAHLWTPFLLRGLERAGLAYVPIIHDAAPHPGDTDFFFEWRLRKELSAACAAVVLSEAVGEQVLRRRPDLPLIRLPIGAHAPYGTVTPAPRWDFLFFGRIRTYKGLDLLRDAWCALSAEHPSVTLRVLGDGNLNSCAPGLADLPGVTVEQRWVADDQLASEVASAHALVLPYREASQSGVVPIALAHGIPVVVTAVGGLPGQIDHGRNGLIVSPDAMALAVAMGRMLDPTLRSRLSTGAREERAKLLDWHGQAASLRECLSRVLSVCWIMFLPSQAYFL
jgi:glycosyltransferase involved in cell wall biosynthesis